MRSTSERERQALLETAFDCGIRHFDAARMYGLGKVEGVLGSFIQSRREQVTITTKYGIQLNAMATKLGGMQTIVRAILNAVPSLRGIVRRRSQALYKEQVLTIADAQSSLETSLRELNTDYIDIFLIHECTETSLAKAEGLLRFLEDKKAEGKIRAYGTATTFANTKEIVSSLPQYTTIAQFDSDLINNHLDAIVSSNAVKSIITHSVLSGALRALIEFGKSKSDVVRNWSEATGIDCTVKSELAQLLIGASIFENPDGIVLFQSTSPLNIKKSCEALVISESVISKFREIVAVETGQLRQSTASL